MTRIMMRSLSRLLALILLLTCNIACGRFSPDDFHPSPSCPRPFDFLNDIQNFADLLRNDCASVSDILKDPILTAVTTEFGPSIISMKQFPITSPVATADKKPWSSWWFPKKEDVLFSGRGSALAKYDVYRARLKSNAESAVIFEQKNYNPKALPWEGLCDAWAIASLVSPEPKHRVTIPMGFRSVDFSIGDLKGLLLKTFEASDDSALSYYGQKFTGTNNGWIYPDIFPEQFHRFVEVQLFQKRKPFIMDHDPGVEVWNVPVYKANYTIKNIPEDPNAVFVTMWIFSAEPTLPTDRDFIGTREAIREYHYVLQGNRNVSGDLVVTSGYWIKGPDGVDSRQDHPDYLIRINDEKKLVRRSWNPEIDVDIVDRILKPSY